MCGYVIRMREEEDETIFKMGGGEEEKRIGM